jgi:primosomal protein N' (replication factor Y)
MTYRPQHTYLEVAVSAPVGRTLTYLPPKECRQTLGPGMRVLVPLGRRKVTGYILSKLATPPSGQKLKEIIEVLDANPLLPGTTISPSVR